MGKASKAILEELKKTLTDKLTADSSEEDIKFTEKLTSSIDSAIAEVEKDDEETHAIKERLIASIKGSGSNDKPKEDIEIKPAPKSLEDIAKELFPEQK